MLRGPAIGGPSSLMGRRVRSVDFVVEHAGARLAGQTWGSGPPVLCLHAGVCDRSEWAPLAALVTDRTLIAFDLRGFGETTYPAGEFDPAADALAVLDHLGIERAVVVGNSYGGLNALALAARAPERIERMLLLAPATPDLDDSGDRELQAYWDAEGSAIEAGNLDAAVEVNLRFWVDRSPAAAPYRDAVAVSQRRAFELQLEAEPDADFDDIDPAAIQVATLVLGGELDTAAFRAAGRELAARIPGAAYEELPGVGHLVPLEATAAVARRL